MLTRRTVLAAVVGLVLCAGAPAPARAQTPEQRAFYNEQMLAMQAALMDPTANDRALKIWSQLVDYSHQRFRVLPAQNFNMGEALLGGIVLLDVALLAYDESVTAFWMAHEYGHQVLGHPAMTATPLGQFIAMSAGTANEDAADRWSAGFMKAVHYPIKPTLSFLCRLPSGGRGDSHSDGPVRAGYVAKTYGLAGDPCSTVRNASGGVDPAPGDAGGRGAASSACMDEAPARCVRVCTKSYGHTLQVCHTICQGTPFNIASWRASCARRARADANAAPRRSLTEQLPVLLTAARSGFTTIRGAFISADRDGRRDYRSTAGIEGFTSCSVTQKAGTPASLSCNADKADPAAPGSYDEAIAMITSILGYDGTTPNLAGSPRTNWRAAGAEVTVIDLSTGTVVLHIDENPMSFAPGPPPDVEQGAFTTAFMRVVTAAQAGGAAFNAIRRTGLTADNRDPLTFTIPATLKCWLSHDPPPEASCDFALQVDRATAMERFNLIAKWISAAVGPQWTEIVNPPSEDVPGSRRWTDPVSGATISLSAMGDPNRMAVFGYVRPRQ